jgi:hypothetical protein
MALQPSNSLRVREYFRAAAGRLDNTKLLKLALEHCASREADRFLKRTIPIKRFDLTVGTLKNDLVEHRLRFNPYMVFGRFTDGDSRRVYQKIGECSNNRASPGKGIPGEGTPPVEALVQFAILMAQRTAEQEATAVRLSKRHARHGMIFRKEPTSNSLEPPPCEANPAQWR